MVPSQLLAHSYNEAACTLGGSSLRRTAATLLLIFATTHCVLSIFYVNTSYLNLQRYANGTERQPFQRRFLMVPVLRLAESSQVFNSLARRYGENVPQPEPMSAEKLASILASILALNAFGLWTTRVSPRLGLRNWWLLWAAVLAILYASYASRYEQALWYPYDLPHMVLFGLGTICILTDQPFFFLLWVAIDAPMRETSLFLIVVAAWARLQSTRWRLPLLASAALWTLARLLAYHLYPTGTHQWNGLHWYNEIKPWHLPQLFSISGFLVLPVWFGKKYLTAVERRVLVAGTALILATFYFSTWNETRAWLEWTTLFAILASAELERHLAHESSLNLQT